MRNGTAEGRITAGGCQCGAVRWRAAGAPVTYYACHCSECRRQSGSAFGLSLIVPAAGFAVAGRLAARARATPAGPMEGRFCPVCGSRIVHARPGAETVSVKGGTMDDPFAWRLAGRIWAEGAPAWALGGEGLLVFAGAPDRAALAARFRALNGLGPV